MLPKVNRDSPSPTDLAARARELAACAQALAAAITTLYHDIRAAQDESVRRAGFRCDTARGGTQGAAGELRSTANDLDCIAASAMPGTCPVPWGVCPNHGNTLISAGGRTWCRAPGCPRTWNYDRVSLPCCEPTRWTVTDQHGGASRMCNGHALDAAERLDGAQAAPLVVSRRKDLA
jgi:hypothetical protein